MSGSESVLIALLYIFSDGNFYADSSHNPCFSAYHKQFPSKNIGSRNEKCPLPSHYHEVCDHTLPEMWYKVDGATILNHCPNGGCGVIYPVWMNGTFPGVSEGIVKRTACMKDGVDCCNRQLQIKVKNCTRFFVYHLVQPNPCPTAYCFSSGQPCIPVTPPSTSSTTAISYTETPSQEPMCIGDTKRCRILIIVSVLVGAILISVCVWILWTKECCKNSSVSPAKDTSIELPPPYESLDHGK